MIEKCDICGLQKPLNMQSGLYVCSQCGQKIVNFDLVEHHSELIPELQRLIGKQAGWITQTLNIPYVYPYTTIIDAADVLQDSLRSVYLLNQIWEDGTTVWRAIDGNELCLVTKDKEIVSKRLF